MRRRILSFLLTVLMILLSAFGGYKMAQCWAAEQACWDRRDKETEALENEPWTDKRAGAFFDGAAAAADAPEQESIFTAVDAPEKNAAENTVADAQTAENISKNAENANESAQSAENARVSLGIFTITAYCPCSVCCGKWAAENAPVTASGMPAEAGKTAGADWDMLPCGTEIEVEGVGQRTVQDKPAKWVSQKYDGRILDLYFDSHEEARGFGKKEAEVWILNSTPTKSSR